MREIKFRAWNGESFYNPIIYDGRVFRDDIDYENNIDYTDQLMQYTELKDKDDKEIFEGDILFWQPLSSTDVECKGEVYYLNGSYWVKKKSDFVPRMLSDICRYHHPMKIGNIYENPYLLEE